MDPEPRIVDTLARPLGDLRISVMDRCNFRCPYCMPSERYPEGYQFLSRREQLTFDEIERIARLLVSRGVHKLRLTGGEPLLRPGLADLVRRLRAIDGVEDLAMTTNGMLLDRHAQALREAGLDRVTVSVDSFDAETFALMSGGRGSLATVLANIQLAREAGFEPIKVNTVLQRGLNDDGALDILEHFRGTGVIVRFIEYMDVGSINDWRREQVVTSAELIKRIEQRWPLRPLSPNYHGEVANRYAYADGQGEVGFVSSVSQPFCRACNRARLSSDGCLYTCLFATRGTDLKGPLRAGRSDAELAALIDSVWRRRADRYSELRGQARPEKRKIEMYYIGG